MADLRKAKKPINATYPLNTIDSAKTFETLEPLLTPTQFKQRFLFGIPTTAPLTGEKLGNADFKDFIKRAVNLVETDSKIDIQARIKRVRLPFHSQDYRNFIHLEIPHKPIRKIVGLTISAATQQGSVNEDDEDDSTSQFPNGMRLYKFPLEWLDFNHLGTISVNPFSPAFSAVGIDTGVTPATSPLTAFLGQLRFTPGFWNVTVLTGVACEETGNIPVVFNEMIGMKAAMLAIDNLIPLFRVSSQSLGIDGLSQSVNDNLYQLLTNKRQQLDNDYKNLLTTLKTQYSQRFFMTSV
jgi:hypothetical protein